MKPIKILILLIMIGLISGGCASTTMKCYDLQKAGKKKAPTHVKRQTKSYNNE